MEPGGDKYDKKFHLPIKHSPVWEDPNTELTFEETNSPQYVYGFKLEQTGTVDMQDDNNATFVKGDEVIIKEEVEDNDDEIKDTNEMDVSMQQNDTFKCRLCSFQSTLKINLQRHMFFHKKIKNNKCTHCSYRCKLKHKLRSHLLVHMDISDVERFECLKCNFQTKYKASLKNHMRVHKFPRPVTKFECTRCRVLFVEQDDLTKHVLLIHQDQMIPNELFECHECQYRCKLKSLLERHLMIHKDLRPIKCDECNYQCKSMGELKSHQLKHRHQSQISMYKCGTCDFRSKYKNSVKMHQSSHRCYAGAKVFTCRECSQLDKQDQRVATGPEEATLSKDRMLLCEKCWTYQCSFCDYKCVQKISLKVHMLDHAALAKRVQCENCNIQFKQESTLQKHLLLCNKKDKV